VGERASGALRRAKPGVRVLPDTLFWRITPLKLAVAWLDLLSTRLPRQLPDVAASINGLVDEAGRSDGVAERRADAA